MNEGETTEELNTGEFQDSTPADYNKSLQGKIRLYEMLSDPVKTHFESRIYRRKIHICNKNNCRRE